MAEDAGGLDYYMPARDMHLRRRNADGDDGWVPIVEALNLPRVIRGTRRLPGSLLTATADWPDYF